VFLRTWTLQLRGVRVQITGCAAEYRKPPRGKAQAASIFKIVSLLVITHTDVQTLELKFPPLGLVIIAALLMWLAAAYFPALNFQFPFQSVVAWVIGLLGALACALGVIEFRRAKTSVNPIKPDSASSLVRTGIYSRTRNPMYLGFFLILVGWASVAANILGFLVSRFVAIGLEVIAENRFQRSLFRFAPWRSEVWHRTHPARAVL